jgi:ribonuclease J
MKDKVRIVFLGGVGEVTKNMFVYEYWKEDVLTDIVIVDCGIGFSEDGEETVLPDVTYLKDKEKLIRGIILSHGHEDHTSALYHLLDHVSAPIYGTRLTLGLARIKLNESGKEGDFRIVKTNTTLTLGNFSIEFAHVTHSIPDATNIFLKTPIGAFYHASDFKFDWSPVDGWQTDVGKIARWGEKGILCLLSDCVRSERKGYTLSEETLFDSIELQVRRATGAVFFTTQSSNISRIQQAMDVAYAFGRKVVLLGRSMRSNTEVAQRLGYLKIPKKLIIDAKNTKKIQPSKMMYIVAGSQAQEDSALSRLAGGEHKDVMIRPNDTIVFSADPIPGYEDQVHRLIDKLTLLKANVAYSDIDDDLHVSGHGSQNDLMLMMGLTKPQYIIPMGGEPRHVRQYARLAYKMGYKERQILQPFEKDAVEFTPESVVVLRQVAQ